LNLRARFFCYFMQTTENHTKSADFSDLKALCLRIPGSEPGQAVERRRIGHVGLSCE
jgi:hypothetical protein